jgi:hypothetical protein
MAMTSITGRDVYITAKALLYAIEAINALPPQHQEWSDLQDMKALLFRMIRDPDALITMRMDVLAHVRGCGVTVRGGYLELADGFVPPPLTDEKADLR